jgi:hypothetical protein
MEILLIACMLAYAAGAQSEQSKLGISPAQRAILKEKSRHEKAVQKIADKHGMKPVGQKAGLSPWKEAPGSGSGTVPDTFMAGYRMQRPSRPPLGHRVGARTGSAITWAQDSGRDAWRAYRESRRKTDDNPKPVLVPMPPAHPPNAPPMPQGAPTVHEWPEPVAAPTKPDDDKAAEKALEPAAQEDTPPESAPAPTREGVGRMAAEVTYESVMDESDELSIMCEDDVLVYDRIRDRAEREIGRGDELMAALENAGFGSKVIAWVARCKEHYGVIRSEVDDLQRNTIAQGEAVVKAKALLEAGQGVYVGIAKDMESVAERGAYISDAVDAEDTQAHTEVYETKAA